MTVSRNGGWQAFASAIPDSMLLARKGVIGVKQFSALLALTTAALPLQAADCPLRGPELVQDRTFAEEAASRTSKHWTGVQHAGEHSYQLDIADGVLTIEKTGTQPWYIFRQRIDPEDVQDRKMRLAAELKLDLEPATENTAAEAGAGLYLKAISRSGKRYTAVFPHEPHQGVSDWVPVEVIVALPWNLARIDVGFTHRGEGSFQVRNPSFREVKSKAKDCPITPGVERS